MAHTKYWHCTGGPHMATYISPDTDMELDLRVEGH